MTRVDVGLNLKGTAAKGRLEASGSFNLMCTHRVRLESAKQVDRRARPKPNVGEGRLMP